MNEAGLILDKLHSLGVDCALLDVVYAPQVITILIEPRGKTRMMDFTRLSRGDDLSYVVGTPVRISAPASGRRAVAIEVARRDRQMVSLDDLPAAWGSPIGSLGCYVGLDTDNRPLPLVISDAPHVLIAGQTGGGKSVALNGILCALLSALGPEELELVMVDLKRVELGAAYGGLPHLPAPVATDMRSAVARLRGLITVMENRYRLMEAISARDLPECNRALEARGMRTLPRVLCVVDELAELMMGSRKIVEPLLVRVAQLGRACGVHLILATQSPRVDVATGLLKANLPTRICFSVSTMADSRVILDRNGAEDLVGRGDGLVSLCGLAPVRFQSPYVGSEDVERAVSRWTRVAA